MRSAGGESDRSDCNATTWKAQSAINADAMLCDASEVSSKKSRNQEIKKSRKLRHTILDDEGFGVS